jgi:putative DNA primase/helicase
MFDGFMAAMRGQGIEPPNEIVADGKFHRFSTKKENNNDTAGWYVLFNGDVNAGSFGDFRQGITQNWCSKSTKEMSREEYHDFERVIEEARRARQECLKTQYRVAAERANVIWDAAEPVETHPYLVDKEVQSYGLRLGRWTKQNEKGEVWLDVPDALIIPITDGNNVWSLQAIFPAPINGRNKDFLKGGRKKGLFHRLGEYNENADTVYICEGYSTGAIIHELTDKLVYIAFDAGNLPRVGENVRKLHPGANIIIAADNDQYGDENPGIKFAKQAQNTCNAHLVFPEFTEDQLENKPTDFNDLYRLTDMFVVLNQLTLKESHVKETEIFEHNPSELTVEPVINSADIDLYTPLPDISSKGRPLSTIENLREVCKRLGVIVRYNVVKKEHEVLIPRESFSKDNYSNASIAWLTSWCSRFNMPIGQIGDYLIYIADKNQYNPVCEWVKSKSWDGVKRFDDFLNTVEAEDNNLKNIFIKRWMLGAIDAAFNPHGVSIKGILVFQGAQDVGKTSWLLSLVPDELGVVKEGALLDPKDRDSIKQCTSDWLVELGELDATFRKSDIAQLKAYIPRNTDSIRLPYARKDSEFSRRTVYFGSVNPREFLGDPTGNSRFWTVACVKINYKHKFDMQQVWAEVYEMYKNGERQHLTPEEQTLRNDNNEEFTVIDPIDERIRTKLDWSSDKESWLFMTTSDALSKCGLDRIGKADITRAANIIRALNGRICKRTAGKRLLLVPPPVQE